MAKSHGKRGDADKTFTDADKKIARYLSDQLRVCLLNVEMKKRISR